MSSNHDTEAHSRLPDWVNKIRTNEFEPLNRYQNAPKVPTIMYRLGLSFFSGWDTPKFFIWFFTVFRLLDFIEVLGKTADSFDEVMELLVVNVRTENGEVVPRYHWKAPACNCAKVMLNQIRCIVIPPG